MSSEKMKTPENVSWKIRRADESGPHRWEIYAEKANRNVKLVLHNYRTDEKGLYVSDFQNFADEQLLNRSELTSLISALLELMNRTNRNKLYAEPLIPGVRKAFSLLGGTTHDENPIHLVVTRAQMETTYKKLAGVKEGHE